MLLSSRKRIDLELFLVLFIFLSCNVSFSLSLFWPANLSNLENGMVFGSHPLYITGNGDVDLGNETPHDLRLR